MINTLPKIVAEIGHASFFETVLDWITDEIPVDAAEIFSFSVDAGPACVAFRQPDPSFAPPMKEPYARTYPQCPLYRAFRDRLPPGLYDPRRLARCYPENRFYDAYYWDRDLGELNLLVPHGRDHAAVLYLGWSKGKQAVDRSRLRELETAEPILRACMQKHMSMPDPSAPAERIVSDRDAGAALLRRCGLTTRELEVAHRMLHGDNVKTTAGRLRIAQGTVQIHRKSIYRKLNVRCLTEFYAFCGVIEANG